MQAPQQLAAFVTGQHLHTALPFSKHNTGEDAQLVDPKPLVMGVVQRRQRPRLQSQRRPPHALQTKRDTEAKGMVKQEFMDNMECIITKALEQGGRREGLTFSWDRVHVNATDAEMAQLGLELAQRLALSPYSPDMHKVIEHFIHRLKQGFFTALRTRPMYYHPWQMQRLLRSVFMSMPREHILADTHTLKLTYQLIAHEAGEVFDFRVGQKRQQFTGVGGNWPPHRYR